MGVCVSVVMPVFNAGEDAALDVAIRSVLDQELSDFELIICDDASTDGTWNRLEEWARRDDRIVLLRNQSNKGAGGARNECIRRAKGSFIALMDADDYSYPQRLKEQTEYLCEHGEVSFVGSAGEYFSETPGDMGERYWFVEAPQSKDFLMTLPFVHASIMFRAEVLRAAEGYSKQRYVTRSEDYDLLMRLYAAGCTGVNLPAALYGIRLNEATYRRRKYRYRLNECAVKWIGFRRMGLMPRGIPFAVKPLIVGLIPIRLLNAMKKKYYK